MRMVRLVAMRNWRTPIPLRSSDGGSSSHRCNQRQPTATAPVRCAVRSCRTSTSSDPGEVVLRTGPSGCGKTTLLTLVGALRSLQHGELQVLVPLAQAGRGDRRRLRQRIGMIFQGHNLLRCLTAEQNVQMGADLLPGSACQRVSSPRMASGRGLEISSAKCPTIYQADKATGGDARALAAHPRLLLG